MCVAAVDLVRKAIIGLLSSTKPNLFASPLFLRVFVPILFMPSPPDLFSGSKELSLSTFQEPSEPQRLVECLALSCVLVQRDHLSSVESSLEITAFDLGKVDEPSVSIRWITDPKQSRVGACSFPVLDHHRSRGDRDRLWEEAFETLKSGIFEGMGGSLAKLNSQNGRRQSYHHEEELQIGKDLFVIR